MNARRRSCRSAFTLLEIMVVVTIIALLAGIAIVKMGSALGEAEEAKAKAQLEQFGIALLSYRAKAGFYPTTAQGLEALSTRPTTEPVPRSWSQLIKLSKDPWGNDYVYESPGKRNPDFDLYSAGQDRIGGTADDIWKD